MVNAKGPAQLDTHDRDIQAGAGPSAGRSTLARPGAAARAGGSAARVLALQRLAGNRAVKQIVARTPERWYRGEAPGVARARIGGSVHDLTDGLYFTDSAQAAQGYADLRAGKTGGGNALEVTFERRSLGKVLDLPAMPAWEQFLAGKPPVASMGRTWREYMARGTEPYNGGFRTFLDQQKLTLADYDAIVAEDLIRNPGARQLVIVNEKVAERIDDRLVRVGGSGAAPPATTPVTPRTPSGGGGGGGAGSRGGADAAGPVMESADGRVTIYRAMGGDEAAELMRFGEFGYSPHGAGKYFAFTRQDAANAGAKLYPDGATIVKTTVPRSYLPASIDTPEIVRHPHIPARGGPAVMAEGEVHAFYDPRAGGWSVHVDDGALDVLNAEMTHPEILSSPAATVPTAPAPPVSTPPAGGGGGTGRAPDEATVAAERVGEDAAADLAEKAAGTAVEGLTFAETVGAAFEAITPILDVLFLAQAGYAIGKALIFHNPAEMDPDQQRLMQLMEAKVMPAAMKELAGHEQEARKLALHDDERDVYARVTMAITYKSSRTVSRFLGPFEDEHVEDAAFDAVTVGYDDSPSKKQKGNERYEREPGTEYRHRTELVTFPILLNPLGRSRGLRRWVAMRANASHAIARGLSARSIAEGTHWVGEHMGPGGYDWTYLDDREEAHRKKAMGPSHRAEVELAAKLAFTEAYIDAASDHMDQPAVKKLYDDAVRYYDELGRTTIDPLYGPVTKQPQQQNFPFPLKPR
jgi:DNA replication initiation complex subunit (GINS family)